MFHDPYLYAAPAFEHSKLMRNFLGRYDALGGSDCALFARKFAPSTAGRIAKIAAEYILAESDVSH